MVNIMLVAFYICRKFRHLHAGTTRVHLSVRYSFLCHRCECVIGLIPLWYVATYCIFAGDFFESFENLSPFLFILNRMKLQYLFWVNNMSKPATVSATVCVTANTVRSTRSAYLTLFLTSSTRKNLQTPNSDKNWQTFYPDFCHTITGQI